MAQVPVYPAPIPRHKGTRANLRETLDHFLATADRQALLSRDPVELVHRFRDPHDQEVVGFIVAMLAYGRASTIKVTTERAIALLGDHPAAAVDAGAIEATRGFVYRFQRGDDLFQLLGAIGAIRRAHGSLAALFAAVADDDPVATMARFVAALPIPEAPSYGLRFLLPTPGKGAAKRLCLFLRWMIRPADGLDLGTWATLHPAPVLADRRRLIIPLDTHIQELGQLLGLTDRSTPDLTMALEITAALARLRPADPLAYDMALCHLGISGQCKKRWVEPICTRCPINAVCRLAAVE